MKPYFKILRGQRHPIRFLLARSLVETGLCRLLTIRQGAYRLRFHASNLSEQLWLDPSSRRDALAFFTAYLRQGDRVVDVGANIGDTALLASSIVGSQGRVWAIEPHPRTFAFLRSNLELNRTSNVEAIMSAVGRTAGQTRFSDDRRDDMNRVGDGEVVVPIQRLDDLVSFRGPVALLKVDVEGFEKFVFEGAHALLGVCSCVHFEISTVHFDRFGYLMQDLLSLLEDEGFSLYRFLASDHLKLVHRDYESDLVENLVGLKEPQGFADRTGWKVSA